MTVVPYRSEAAEATPVVCISQVCASYPGEFISIMNQGLPIDLKGWRLSDGEGSVVLNVSFLLRSGEQVSWCESPERFLALYPGERVLCRNSSEVLLKGSLKLADQGDQVYLFDADGRMVDVLHYGTSEPLPPWSGPSVPCRKGEMMVRYVPSIGYDSWRQEKPGLFSITTGETSAYVTPILYPDDGLTAMVREIDRAEESIHMAAYIIENWTLARHLGSAAARGVEVTLLLEGQPVGGVSDNGAAIAYYLQDAGAEVWIMRSSDSFRRYDYLHAKYLVFDQERLLVSSENMADSSFSTNRGWAVLVHSVDLAQSALEVFQRDLSGRNVDVFPLDLSLPRKGGGPGRLHIYDHQANVPQFPAMVSLASSPFQVHELILSALKGAEENIRVQQMSIDEDWLQNGKLMEAVCEAARRGVQVRILLDNGLGTGESNGRTASALNARAGENGWDLECRLTSEASLFERMHNKGVIVDDTVLVGSANWVDGSMERNREIMVMLVSPELAAVYQDWFMDDWKGDARPPTIEVPWHFSEVSNGHPIFLDATECYDHSGIAEFSWDLDGDGVTDLSGPTQLLTLPVGEHHITLTVRDTLGNAAVDTMTVKVVPQGASVPSLLLYAPVPIIALLLLISRLKRSIY